MSLIYNKLYWFEKRFSEIKCNVFLHFVIDIMSCSKLKKIHVKYLCLCSLVRAGTQSCGLRVDRYKHIGGIRAQKTDKTTEAEKDSENRKKLLCVDTKSLEPLVFV